MSESALPYAGTSGHSGTDTSKERAEKADTTGKTNVRQRWVLARLTRVGAAGVTVKDVRLDTGWHHGVASSTLTNLHIMGRIVRLAQKRDRCHVYVLERDVLDRDVSPYVPNKRNRPEVDVEKVQQEWYEKGYEAGSGDRLEAESAALLRGAASATFAEKHQPSSAAELILEQIKTYLGTRVSDVAWVSELSLIIENGERDG